MNTGMQISAYMNKLEQHVQSCTCSAVRGRIVRCRFIDVLISKPRGEGNTLHSLNRVIFQFKLARRAVNKAGRERN